MEVGETKKQRKRNMKEDEWRGAKKEETHRMAEANRAFAHFR